jgi:hypothetical protein
MIIIELGIFEKFEIFIKRLIFMTVEVYLTELIDIKILILILKIYFDELKYGLIIENSLIDYLEIL